MNAADHSSTSGRRQLSLDPRGAKFFGVTIWVAIFLGYLATMPFSPNYSTGEVVFTLTFILGGLVLVMISLRRFRQVSLEGDSLYLADRRGEVRVPLKLIEDIVETGDRNSGSRMLRVRLEKPLGFGKEFYFYVCKVDPEVYSMFATYEPHPLVGELRSLVDQARQGA